MRPNRALPGLVVGLGLFIFVAATAAVWLGVNEARLAASGPRRDLLAEELARPARGWVALFGCVRHDLAVGVSAGGVVYALGATPPDREPRAGAVGADADRQASPDEDRVFTPLSSRADCDEGKPPKRIYALIEDDDALANTIGRVYKARVAPPPVPAFVDGVIGYGAGNARLARAARAQLGLDHGVPLLAKGRHPGVLWVAIVTAAVGLHGYLLLIVVALWLRRRRRRAVAAAHFTDEENDFLNSH
jgi:hypothetical protein